MTIAVDSSALLAVLFRESDQNIYRNVLSTSTRTVISAVNLHESRIVVSMRMGEAGLSLLDRLLEAYGVEIMSFDAAQAAVAFEAHQTFGKGNHRARLNLCDCAAYALAKSLNAPLLFKGDDFRQTDIELATS